jgi:DNA-binding PadR family transcriptional regulator
MKIATVVGLNSSILLRETSMNISTNAETIAFYDVPLVCGAAPSIGCGSRAKPLLVDLERQGPIKEAWLNRTGTIVAIVWRGPARMEEVGRPVFERHEIQYTEIPLDDKQAAQSFRIDGRWFRGAEVDRLSLEEAREIAETSVASITEEGLVSLEEATQIKSDIEAYFRKELVRFRTREELQQDARSKFPKEVISIYQKHIGTERAVAVQNHGVRNPF